MKNLVLFVTLLSSLGVFCADVSKVFMIDEEQPSGTIVGDLMQDTELHTLVTTEEAARLKYEMSKQGTTVAKFKLDANSSTLRTAEVLDRDTECAGKESCKLSFDVTVYELKSGGYDLHSIVRLTVILLDINDNPPEFPQGFVSLSLRENIQIGEMILTNPAHDLDTANNSVQSYIMTPDEGVFELKEVTDGGNKDLGILIKANIDREERDTYQFVIVAKDGGNPQKTGSMTVNIQVLDENDNRPVFTNSTFEVTVAEDLALDSSILKLRAEDSDIGVNGALSFHFSSRTNENIKKYFSIEEKSGDVKVIKKLDYEEEKQYRFVVMVKDNGTSPYSSQAEVIVNIGDVNDNAPYITVRSSFDVSEDADVDSFVASFKVTDRDSNENREVNCSTNDEHFYISKFSFEYYKIFLSKKLDYEETKSYSVNITCADSGQIPKVNSTTFTVNVLDFNDNSPVFPRENVTAHITENNHPGEIIMTLTAIDKDGEGNNDVSYAVIEDSLDMAEINILTGEIRVKRRINREQINKFSFRVEARDSGSPAQRSFATVTVIVDDVNDEAPEFTKPHFEFDVPEGRPVSMSVGTLSATDADALPKLLFYLIGDEVSDAFSVSTTTGEIITRKKLDRFVKNKYDFSVMVMDEGNISFNDTANVTVYVIEDRAVPPTILYPMKGNNSIRIPFDMDIGRAILAVKTDTKTNTRQARFLIEHGNEENFFKLDENFGNLTLVKAMRLKDAGLYKLLISTYYENNPGQKSFVTVDIIVTGSDVKEEDGNSYIVIVIIIVCVTVILAGAILLAICMMKRVDRERKESKKRKKEELEKVYNVDSIEKLAAASDDKVHVMVKQQLSFRDEKHSQKKLQKEMVDVTSQPVQKKIVQFADHPVTKVEDDISNLSAEADSGHGGSEEDFNSNGRFVYLHNDPDSSQQLSPSESFDFRPETSILSSSSLREWMVETPRRVNLPVTYVPSERSYTPVREPHPTETAPPHHPSTSQRVPPTRKSSARNKSVRFSVDEPDVDGSSI
ncbi:protocadherin-11 X-linked-like isoform X1 [Haliotis rufescens]|uniref:protocadherin-11 X-linked-like isoform X1 n=1 Tax=Haliotis rufescens TaxID=6454 RepID=UPI001EAFCAE2|nr:protocadherin-11 X-linked-like isoform X1 [Haliotis rufescens]XP_046352647.1 protocadherin-11 X-linked-like isoform X1 [Haliotis rufescens]XP_046352648.1 protocadherin-11 X-linked-like isoform X1 [Haliotis rufescens]